ncbi:hypothetical protein V6N13_034240 [Hibiscus sabdariffa]|uniref:Isopenicillin N synthase-like Fe(2+) 2OG dioxygenase domain-containing protein n=1 Tax=Hibiscus sabdariffa TaxID=183260 RepID=A0ABR2F833_9ROSI
MVHLPLKGMEASLGGTLMGRKIGLITSSTGYSLLRLLTTSSGLEILLLTVRLWLEPDVLKQGAEGEEIEYLMMINYYPSASCPRPDLSLGVASHTDLSTMTLFVPNEIP